MNRCTVAERLSGANMEQTTIVKTENHWVEAVQIAWPAVLESFFLAMAGVIDTIMIASIGTYAVAAVGLTSQPKFLMLSIFIAISVAVSALVARRKGQEDQVSANETLVTSLFLSLGFCVIITLISLFFANPILHLAGSNEETHEAATMYFRIIMGGIFCNIGAMIINASQRGSGNTRIAFTTNLVSTIINICGNWLLIGGRLGFPKLGIQGAAIATVFGSFVALCLSVSSLFRKSSFVRIRFILERNIKATLKTVKNIFHLASSIFLENIAMRIGFVVTAFLAARLGTEQFAAHQVGMNMLMIGFSFADGMQVAAVALTGRALGSGDKTLAKQYGLICQRIGFCISIALSAFLFFLGEAVFRLYFDTDAVLQYSSLISHFIMIVVLAQISQVIFGGCLRAAGDVKYTLFVSIVSVTLIRSVVTIVLVLYLQWGLAGIWLGILSDQVSRLLFMSIRYMQGKWVDLTI